jgi:hypothetical protein
MRFDWYAATIKAHPAEVLEVLQKEFGAEIKRGNGLHGYTHRYDVNGPAGTVASVLAGGKNGDPHAWASGENTDRFVGLVRSVWSDAHTVTRFDPAEDFQGPGTWDRLNAECLSIADDRRLKVSQAGDYHRLEDGRTLYVGSRKSPVFIRLYEKGKQLRAKVSQGAEDIPEDWCRLEAQIRPQKEAKKSAAYLSPEQAWGLSSWTNDLAKRCLEIDVPRVQMKVWREADDDRAFAFMVRQYGPMLERLKLELGDWSCVGLQIGQAVSDRRQKR